MYNLTGENLYRIVKPHLDISFNGDTNEDKRSLENLDKIDTLLNALFIDLDDLNRQLRGKNEYSAELLRNRLKGIQENLKEYFEDWEENK